MHTFSWLVVLFLCSTIWIRHKECWIGGHRVKKRERWTSRGGSAAVDIRSSGAAVFQPKPLPQDADKERVWKHTQNISIVELNSCFIYTLSIFKTKRSIASFTLTCCLTCTKTAFLWVTAKPKISCLLKAFSSEASRPELKTWRNGKPICGSLFHQLITVTVEQFCLISHVSFAWLQL